MISTGDEPFRRPRLQRRGRGAHLNSVRCVQRHGTGTRDILFGASGSFAFGRRGGDEEHPQSIASEGSREQCLFIPDGHPR